MLNIEENILKIEVKSGLSEPLKATDHGRFKTLTRATKANIFNIFEADKNSLLINTSINNGRLLYFYKHSNI